VSSPARLIQRVVSKEELRVTRRNQTASVLLIALTVFAWLPARAAVGSEPAEADRTAPVSLSGPGPGTYVIRTDEAVTIPFEFYGMNLLVEGTIRGVPVRMLIDNGSLWNELWFFSSALTESLGIAREDSVLVQGAGEGEGVSSYTASGIPIRFGAVEFLDQPAIITPEEQGIASMFPGIDGQICGCLFRHFVVEFDFDRQVIVLHDPGSYRYTGDGCTVTMTRNPMNSYTVPTTIRLPGGQSLDLDLELDLGGVHPVSLVVGESVDAPLEEMERTLLGYGASGPIYGYEGTIEDFELGSCGISELPAVFIDPSEDTGGSFSTVGLPVFRRFNVVFDYFAGRLHLEPNGHFLDPFDEWLEQADEE
jgi:hypothetical protein